MKSKKQVTNGNGNNQQSQPENQQLKQNQVPDSTNKSTGVPGTGQRQDSN